MARNAAANDMSRSPSLPYRASYCVRVQPTDVVADISFQYTDFWLIFADSHDWLHQEEHCVNFIVDH